MLKAVQIKQNRKEELEKIKDLYGAGYSTGEIARQLGKDPANIRRARVKLKIKPRTSGGKSKYTEDLMRAKADETRQQIADEHRNVKTNGTVEGTLNPKGITRAIVLPDHQVPYHDEKSLRAVEKFMATREWDYYINLGDFLDLAGLSHFNKGLAANLSLEDVGHDFDVGNEILDRHQAIIRKNNKNAKFVLLEGNHEFRSHRFTAEMPQLRNILSVEERLGLTKRDMEYVKCYEKGDDFKLGHAHFTHGLYTNDLHAKKHVNQWGTNIFYGHLHDVQTYSAVVRGDGKTIVGQSLGCLCDYKQSYIKGNPTRWQQAFAVFDFLPDGNFTYNVIRIFNNQFVYDGEVFSG